MNLLDAKMEYLKYLKLSRIELDGLDSRTKFTQEGLVNSAKQKLTTLRPQVMGMVLGESTTVFISSDVDLSNQVSSITQKNGNITVIDYMKLENDMFSVIFSNNKNGNYIFNAETVNRINHSLFDLRNAIGATFIPSIKMAANEYKVIKSADGNLVEEKKLAMSFLQELLQKTFDNDLKSLYIAKTMNDVTDKNMAEYDKMVFFVINTMGNTKGLDQITGKTVFINNTDDIPEDPAGLQKLVTSKLKKNKKPLTVTETE